MKIIVNESQVRRILKEIASDEIEARTRDINLTPTDAQKEAGNYKMGHISVKGMQISIENPRGSYRKYKTDDGGNGYNLMHNHYGYFNITKGKDGDAVDVFIGPDIDDFENVYCVDQNNKEGEFDETKVMLGFTSADEAKRAYLSNYSKGWTGFRAITGVSLKVFKKWLYRGRKQRQPFEDYVYIQKKKLEEAVFNQSQNDKFNSFVQTIEDEIRHSFEGAHCKLDYNFGYLLWYFRGWVPDASESFIRKAISKALANLSEKGVKLHYYKGA